MGQTTKIEWCDGTANFWNGCTKVSEECANCYAEERDSRYAEGIHWGPGAPRVQVKAGFETTRRMHRASMAGLFRQAPDGTRRIYRRGEPAGDSWPVRPKLFSNSLSDIWDEEVGAAQRVEALASIIPATYVDFMLLSKRPQHARRLLHEARDEAHATPENRILADHIDQWLDGKPPRNVALGVTVGLQKYTGRLERLASDLDAAAYFVSAEPLLGSLTGGLQLLL